MKNKTFITKSLTKNLFIISILVFGIIFNITFASTTQTGSTWELPQIIIDTTTKKIYITSWYFQNTGFTNPTELTGKKEILKIEEEEKIEKNIDIEKKEDIEKNINIKKEIGIEMEPNKLIQNDALPEYEQSLARMYANWLTKYNDKKEYRPDDYLTREESAKIIWKLYSTLGYSQTIKNTWCNFSDTDIMDPSLSWHIQKVCQRGLFKGSNWKFMPRNQLTKPQAIAVLIRMFEGKLSEETQSPRRERYYLKWRKIGLINSWSISNYDKPITRKEIAIYAFRLKNIATNEQLRIISLNEIKKLDTPTQEIINTETLGWDLSSLAGTIDVTNDPELVAAIWRMYDNGITQFEDVNNYMPFSTLSRVAAAKILDVFSDKFGLWQNIETLPDNCNFTDIDNLNQILANHIKNVCKKWFFKGSSSIFNPNQEISKAHFIVALVRMLEGKYLDETQEPRRKNYYEKALELWIISPADALTFQSPTTRYEAALYLYRFKIKYQMLNNLNNNRLQNEIISTVPWSIIQNTETQEANVYLDTNLIKDGNFEIGYIEIFGNRYKIVKTATEKYFTDNFVRYWELFNLTTNEKIWTTSFIVSNSTVIEGTIRLTTTDKKYNIQTLEDTNAYYKITEIN